MNLRSPLLFLLLSLFAAPMAQAGMRIDGKPKVAFFAVGNTGFLDIEGTTSDLVATDDGTTLSFACKLDTVSTGIGLRDEHMKSKFMHTQEYPTTSLSFPKSAVPWPVAVGESADGTAAAAFTAHGVTKDVAVAYVVRKTKTGFRITAKFPFDIAQHGIAVPSYLGVTVETVMRAEVAFDLVDAP